MRTFSALIMMILTTSVAQAKLLRGVHGAHKAPAGHSVHTLPPSPGSAQTAHTAHNSRSNHATAGSHDSRKSHGVQVIIHVNLGTQWIHVQKFTKHGKSNLDGRTLAVAKGSIRTGLFRPLKMYTEFKSVGSNTYLENVIFFSGGHAIRTSRLFNYMLKNKQPSSGSIILEPDFGAVVYEAVRHYGMNNTWIKITK